ncbi:MAG: response regulator, partial [Candidatus Electrothrix sp. ATG2]|nr:response regulator [Candidatus Electrothrix sp. ATG2]
GPTNIHQIILNLFSNGFHAIGHEQGTLHIRLKRLEVPAKRVTDKPEVKPGSFVELTVQDSGQGIDEITINRIFDPYFTTKEQGAGTGLGLAVIHGIVEDCNGFIEVESITGQGTAFHVYLPTVNQEKTIPPKEIPHEPLLGGHERILFVDDEADIARINRSLLSNLGYRVTVETQSRKALEKIQKNPKAFDLLITDHTMPGLTGADLARSVLQLRPDLPIILCTGYTAAFSEQEAWQLGIKKYAIKPLPARKMAEIVREVLDE